MKKKLIVLLLTIVLALFASTFLLACNGPQFDDGTDFGRALQALSDAGFNASDRTDRIPQEASYMSARGIWAHQLTRWGGAHMAGQHINVYEVDTIENAIAMKRTALEDQSNPFIRNVIGIYNRILFIGRQENVEIIRDAVGGFITPTLANLEFLDVVESLFEEAGYAVEREIIFNLAFPDRPNIFIITAELNDDIFVLIAAYSQSQFQQVAIAILGTVRELETLGFELVPTQSTHLKRWTGTAGAMAVFESANFIFAV